MEVKRNRFDQDAVDNRRESMTPGRDGLSTYSPDQWARLDGLSFALDLFDETSTKAEIIDMAQTFADFIQGAPDDTEGI